MRNKNDALIEKIKSVLASEMEVIQLCKSVSEFSVPEIASAIQRLRYEGYVLGKNLNTYGCMDRSYYNTLEFWSDVLRPRTRLINSKSHL